MLTRFLAAFAAHRDYRRTVRVLSHLSDRELRDIGLSRYDIESVARGATEVPAAAPVARALPAAALQAA